MEVYAPPAAHGHASHILSVAWSSAQSVLQTFRQRSSHAQAREAEVVRAVAMVSLVLLPTKRTEPSLYSGVVPSPDVLEAIDALSTSEAVRSIQATHAASSNSRVSRSSTG
jgi:hypothetical protein